MNDDVRQTLQDVEVILNRLRYRPPEDPQWVHRKPQLTKLWQRMRNAIEVLEREPAPAQSVTTIHAVNEKGGALCREALKDPTVTFDSADVTCKRCAVKLAKEQAVAVV